ncbi:MAG: Fic family protein [Gammaproteobacteria bacterium]|nr:Fic family protein [Gammaproteobacteria bacterium]
MIMLFQTPQIPANYAHVIEKIENARKRLRYAISDNLNRWTGFLARMSYARAIHGTNSMEGINATFEDAVAVVDGEEPLDPEDQDKAALVGHREAMDYVIQLSKEPNFQHNEGTLLGLHYMMMKYDFSKFPGRYRPGPVHVTHIPTNEIVYEGPDHALVPGLMAELIVSLNEKNGTNPIIRAAMAHLNLTMIHPFRDGNGRMARALQTFVLAREGILDPRFSSIEEYVGKHSQHYYDVLAEVGKGQYNPQRNALPWIKFCLRAHYSQVNLFVRRMQELDRVWQEFEKLITSRGLPDRTINALIKACIKLPIRNPSYRKDAEVSAQVAKRDLKALVDAKLLIPQGVKRGRVYVGSPEVIAIRQQNLLPVDDDDPFEERTTREIPEQRSIFEET